jgi:isopenicillin N synthase-like dioxygenase
MGATADDRGIEEKERTMIDSVPVIDVTELQSPAALDAIDRACRDWGFFQVTGHGIDPLLISSVFDVARAFFAQPGDEKRRLLRDAENPWGYYDRELTKNRQDWKEIFDFGPADGDKLKPRWPAGPLRLRFEPIIRAYYASCKALSLRLLSAIATNLGVTPELLARSFGEDHTSFLRLNYYPEYPLASHDDSRPLGVGEHTDSGALTLLLQDSQPGLEVCRDGRWHLVAPRADALVVNIGDMVQVWSNDRYRAAMHRVITSPDRDRYSVPFFLNPSWDTVYAPLPTTIQAGQSALYRHIHWREFRRLRAAGDYADVGEEIQIAHYRQ